MLFPFSNTSVYAIFTKNTNINAKDTIFLGEIIFNIFMNIIWNTNIWASKHGSLLYKTLSSFYTLK